MTGAPDPRPWWHWWIVALQKTIEAILEYDRDRGATSGSVEVTVADKPQSKEDKR